MRTWIILLFYCLPIHGRAQESKKLNEVIIHPNQMDVSPEKSGRSYTIIDQNDIKNYKYTHIEDLLNCVLGVHLNSRGGFGVQNDIGMRGSTFNQCAILIDHVRYNELHTGHFNGYIPLSMNEIDRIEIIRGPAAVAYGSDAIGGIIHIITKAYAYSFGRKDAVGTKGEFFYGENRLLLTDFNIQKSDKNFVLTTSYKKSFSSGQSFSNPAYPIMNTSDSVFHTGFNIRNLSVATHFKMNSDNKVYIRGGMNLRNMDTRFFYTRSLYDESKENVYTMYGQVNWQRIKPGNKIECILNYKKLNDYFLFNPQFTANQSISTTLSAQIFRNHQMNSRVHLSYGLLWTQYAIQSSDRGNHTLFNSGAFMHILLQDIQGFDITFSHRLNRNNLYGIAYTPQLNIAKPLRKNIIFRTGLGSAFRNPDFTELYVSDNIQLLSPGRNKGNPELNPERFLTADIGLDFYHKKKKWLETGFFYRKGKELIDYTFTNSNRIGNNENLQPDAYYYYAQNVGNARSYGFETAMQGDFPIWKNAKGTMSANYAYLHTRTDTSIKSKYLVAHPKHLINVSTGIQTSYWDIMLNVIMRYRENDSLKDINGFIPPQYTVGNLLLRIKPIPQAGILLKVFNILDREYQEILGAPMPRRWFCIGIDWDLEK